MILVMVDINYIYYADSHCWSNFKNLIRSFNLEFIALFLLIAYYLLVRQEMLEQNQVWVGMAKETASIRNSTFHILAMVGSYKNGKM